MKKYPFILMLMINQSALAYGEYQTPKAMHYLTGFYFKAGMGGTIAQYDASQDFTDIITPSIPFSINQPVNHDAQGTQVAGTLGMGYAYQIDALWILGAEFTMGFTGANASFHNSTNANNIYILNSTSDATLYNDFALVLKPGLVIQQKTQFYALLGTRWGNFHTSTSSNVSILGETTGESVSASNYVLGFTAGIGVERMFTDHWSLALEYAYTSYGDIPNASVNYTAAGGVLGTGEVSDEFSATAASSSLFLETRYRF
jgi:opacity protein-like surface antigen